MWLPLTGPFQGPGCGSSGFRSPLTNPQLGKMQLPRGEAEVEAVKNQDVLAETNIREPLKYLGSLIAIGDYTIWFTGDYDCHSRETYQPTSIMRWDRGI